MAEMASNVNGNVRKSNKQLVKLVISADEQQFRRNKYPNDQSIISTRLVCTMCGINIKHRMVTENNIHPILEVLLCKKCKYFYDGRNFESNTSKLDKYCKWCAKDRNLLNCSTCNAKFCDACISRNFHLSRLVFQEIKEKKWECFVCVSKPIWPQRAITAAVKQYVDTLNNTLQQRIGKCAQIAGHSKTSLRRQSSIINVTNTRSGSLRSASSETNISNVSNMTLLQENVVASDENVMKPHTVSESNKEIVSDTAAVSDEDDRKNCVICWNSESRILLYPCGHYCLCKFCAETLKRQDPCCPICRMAFTDIVKVYKN